MDFARLFAIADRARRPGRLSADDIAFVRDDVPVALADFPRMKLPEKLAHPAGFTLSGAPVHTFVKCALLIAGQKALGHRFGGHRFYERVEENLALSVMRSNFHGGLPKGLFCCQQCSLAVLTVLDAGAIRYFDSRALAHDVRALAETGAWRFSTAKPAMLRWALAGPA